MNRKNMAPVTEGLTFKMYFILIYFNLNSYTWPVATTLDNAVLTGD